MAGTHCLWRKTRSPRAHEKFAALPPVSQCTPSWASFTASAAIRLSCHTPRILVNLRYWYVHTRGMVGLPLVRVHSYAPSASIIGSRTAAPSPKQAGNPAPKAISCSPTWAVERTSSLRLSVPKRAGCTWPSMMVAAVTPQGRRSMKPAGSSEAVVPAVARPPLPWRTRGES